MSEAESLAEYFQKSFLDEKNRIAWGALGSSIVGGFILNFWDGLVGYMNGGAEAINRFTDIVTTAYTSGQSDLLDTITNQVSGTFTAIDVGPISGPVNLIITLLAFVALALLIGYLLSIRRDF